MLPLHIGSGDVAVMSQDWHNLIWYCISDAEWVCDHPVLVFSLSHLLLPKQAQLCIPNSITHSAVECFRPPLCLHVPVSCHFLAANRQNCFRRVLCKPT